MPAQPPYKQNTLTSYPQKQQQCPQPNKKSPAGKISHRAFNNYATYPRPEKTRILYPSTTTINEA